MLKDCDRVLFTREEGETRRGMIEIHSGINFFVGDCGFKTVIKETDIIIKEREISVKINDVPIRYKYLAEKKGMTMTSFCLFCMEKEYQKQLPQ